jgi:hypothetical protein
MPQGFLVWQARRHLLHPPAGPQKPCGITPEGCEDNLDSSGPSDEGTKDLIYSSSLDPLTP